jgi:hypothetical protein
MNGYECERNNNCLAPTAEHVRLRTRLVPFGVYIKAWILSQAFGKLAWSSL